MKYQNKLNFRLEKEDYMELLRLSIAQNKNISEIIRQSIKEYLYNRGG